MDSKRPDNNPDFRDSQVLGPDFSRDRPDRSQATRKARAPRGDQIFELVDLTEIKQRWGVGEDRVWRAVALGHVKAYGRPGRQKYYSASEIEAWLRTSASGRQLSFGELDDDRMLA